MAAPNQYPYSRSSRTPAPQPPISYGASAYAVPQLPPRRGSGAMPAPGISFAAHHGALAEEDDVLRPLPPRRVATGFAIPRSTTAPPSSSAFKAPARRVFNSPPPPPPPVQQPVHNCPRPYCNKSFSTLSELDSHIREHLRADNPCACPYPRCYERFKLPSQVKDHYQTHFNEPEFYYCQNVRCGKQYGSQQEVEQHMRRKHPSMFVR